MHGRVAVIVPTYNASRTLGACLDSLARQERSPDEVIVVDAGSVDDTVEIAQGRGVRVLLSGANRSAQRNLGAERAEADYLLFVDADMVLAPDVITECLATVSADEVALVIPEVSIGRSYWARVKAFERSFYQGVWWMEAARWFPRDVFWRVGGYEAGLIGGEDWDLDERVRSIGHVGRVQALIYHDEGAPKLVDLVSKKAHYATTLKAYAERHGDRATMQLSACSRAVLLLRSPWRLLCHPALSVGVCYLGYRQLRLGSGRIGPESANAYQFERPW